MTQRLETIAIKPIQDTVPEKLVALPLLPSSHTGAKLSLSMFDPQTMDRELVKWVRELGGRPALAYLNKVRRGRVTESPLIAYTSAARKADQEIYNSIRERFIEGAEMQYSPRAFILRHFLIANEGTTGVSDKLFSPLEGGDLDLKDETSEPSTRPSDRIFFAASPIVDERVRLETGRQAGVALISAPREKIPQIELHDRLATVQRIYGKYLYKALDRNGEVVQGKIGEGRSISKYVLFDDTTNTALRILDSRPTTNKPGTHVKKITQNMRYVEGVGPVLTIISEKSPYSAVMKSIAKAEKQFQITGDDTIDPIGSVNDDIRMTLVVMGGQDNHDEFRRDHLIQRAIQELENHYHDDQYPLIPKEKGGIVEDNERDGQTGQSPNIRFKRLKISLGNLPPLEQIFYTEKDYLNSRYEVGVFDEIKGQYNGAAHAIYEGNRAWSLIRMFPGRFYNPRHGDQNLRKLARNSAEATAKELKRALKIHLRTERKKTTGTDITTSNGIKASEPRYISERDEADILLDREDQLAPDETARLQLLMEQFTTPKKPKQDKEAAAASAPVENGREYRSIWKKLRRK